MTRRWWVGCIAGGLCMCLVSGLALAQDKKEPPKTETKKPGAAKPEAKKDDKGGEHGGMPDMSLMMPNENHKLLAGMAGDWTFENKFWMDPSAPPQISKGTSTNKAIYDGRYIISEIDSMMEMPGPDGKPMKMPFKGMGINGYDNARGKFVSSWIDNMGTGIMLTEGTYDAGAKTFTYTGETNDCENPKTMVKVREVVKIIDADHHSFEFYMTREGKETKAMEITYARKK